MGIGTLTLVPGVLLELYSTDKGIFIPHLADTNNVTSSANSLLIYLNTTNTFYYFDGILWKPIVNLEPIMLKDKVPKVNADVPMFSYEVRNMNNEENFLCNKPQKVRDETNNN